MRIGLLMDVVMICGVCSGVFAQNITAVKIGSRIDVSVDGMFFTSYRFSADEKYPFFFPVNGPSGASVTSMRNGEFPHHSSLFFGCDQVNGGNYWQEGLERGQIVSDGAELETASGKEIVITDACGWRRPGADQPFKEVRRIEVSAPSKGLRQIDFDVTLEALVDVAIKKTNHSLFSGRMDPDLSVRCGGAMVNAQGECGEKGTFGKPSPWMACSGRRGSGAVEGMAILQHPANPWFPSPWFTRDYGFFSPTPMFWPSDGVSTKLAKGEKLRLRYRVLVFSGGVGEAGVGQRFADYAGLPQVRLVTLDPGHFHAALVQKRMYPRVATEVSVYAPTGPDVALHQKRIERFNARAEAPTAWQTGLYTGDDFLERMLAERKGNVVVISGKNAKKARYILESVKAGFNVLADKPMAVTPADLVLLKEAFAVAAEKRLLLYDIMTERYEITTQLQRHFAGIPELFGGIDPGTPEDPSVTKESVHHFCKLVDGTPIQRPPWFFDVRQQGEAIVDVTTHLVDLIQWELFPDQVIAEGDVKVLNAKTWKTAVTAEQFKRVTATQTYPDYLEPFRDASGALQLPCNGAFTYVLRGVHCKVSVAWNFEAPAGTGDTHHSLLRGKRLSAVIRQGAAQGYRPELYLEPRQGVDAASLEEPLARAVAAAEQVWPGVTVRRVESGWKVVVPESCRTDHESHFGQVVEKYLGYLDAGAMPAWEVPNMLQKYRTTLEAYERSR